MRFLDNAKRAACNRCLPAIEKAKKKLEYLRQVGAVSPALMQTAEQLATRLRYVDELVNTMISVDDESMRQNGV